MSTNKSAVVIIPPKNVWQQIQNIRSKYDKGYERWMPHINLAYPFKQDTEFKLLVSELESELRAVKPFTISFTRDSFGYFQHAASCGMWLKPLLYSPQVIKQITNENNRQQKSQTVKKSTVQPQTSKPTIKRESVERNQVWAIGYNYQPSNNNQTPSLDNLKDAIWTPADNSLFPSTNHNDVGLHNLKNAVWKPGDCDRPTSTHSCSIPASYCVSAQLAHYSVSYNDAPASIVGTGAEPECYDHLSVESQIMPDEEFQFVPTSLKQKYSTIFHPSVIEIQKVLEKMYPKCNQLSTIGENGFHPHLTLGQFKKGLINQQLKEFKDNWTTINFIVDEIHLISRKGFKDPFEIRESISLG